MSLIVGTSRRIVCPPGEAERCSICHSMKRRVTEYNNTVYVCDKCLLASVRLIVQDYEKGD